MNIQTVQNAIGARIRKLREDRGLKQRDLAEHLGITAAGYGKLESGERGLSSEYCIALAEYYGITCDYILRGIKAEYVDVCKRTTLDQNAFRILIENKEQTNELFASMYSSSDMSMKLRKLEKEYSDELASEMTDDRLRKLSSTIEQTRAAEKEAEEYHELCRKWRISNEFLNRFIKDQQLWNDLRRSGYQFVSNLEDISILLDGSKESLLMEQKEMLLDAAKYIAGQAFANFFSQTFKDADFYRKVSEMPESEIADNVRKGILSDT